MVSQRNRKLIVTAFVLPSIFSTYTTYNAIMSGEMFIHTAYYDHFSTRGQFVSIVFAAASTLFIYAFSLWQFYRAGIAGRCLRMSVAAYCAVVTCLLPIGFRQIRAQDRNTDLMYASERGDDALVTRLLDSGANVDTHDLGGATPLLRAAQYGRATVVRTLLSHGAAIDALDKIWFTSMAMAPDQGQTETIALLAERGANVNVRDRDGKTPLIWAAAFADSRIVQTLIAHGADVNARDQYGKTALMMAAGDNEELGSRGNPASIRALVAAHADPTIKDHNGKTALDLAPPSMRQFLSAALYRADASQASISKLDSPKSTANWP